MHRLPDGVASKSAAPAAGTRRAPSDGDPEVRRARQRYLDLLRARLRAGAFPDPWAEHRAIDGLLDAWLADRPPTP